MDRSSSNAGEDSALLSVATEFDFSAIEHAFGEAQVQEVRALAFQIATRAAIAYTRWLLFGRRETIGGGEGKAPLALEIKLPMIAKRALASAWVVNPGLFSGRGLRGMARELDISKSQLSDAALSFSQQFTIHGRGQKTESVRARYRSRPQSIAKRAKLSRKA